MIPSTFEQCKVLVMGLGRFGGGVGVTRWLCNQGAHVTVTDSADAANLAKSVGSLADCPVVFHLGGHDPSDLNHVDLVVVSPAVDRRRSSLFAGIVERGIPWTTEINLFLQRCRGQVIGVTGTAGKSTTCALLAQVLAHALPSGRRVWFGGNVGKSLLGDLSAISSDDTVILELSSFQLESLPQIERSPEIAVITNAWPNHLDRHGRFDDYLSAKLNMFRYQRSDHAAVVAGEDESLRQAVAGITSKTGARLTEVSKPSQPFALRMPGRHNQANAACAATVASLMGIEEAAFRHSMAGFGGLPHRLQYVVTIDGVDYYNDSKSTTPRGTATGVTAFERPVVAIVGGQERGDDLTALAESVASNTRVTICMGHCGPRMAKAVLEACHGEQVPIVETAEGLEEAFRVARRLARPGDGVVLSPGAPSYDQFANYERRGEAFVNLVRAAGQRQ